MASFARPINRQNERLSGPALDSLSGGAVTCGWPPLCKDKVDLTATIMEMGISVPKCHELMMEEWNDACVPPWDSSERLNVVKHAVKYMQNEPGSKRPRSIEETFGQSQVVKDAIAAEKAKPGLLSSITEIWPYNQ